MNVHPSELALERHLLEPASPIGAHLETCARCAERLTEMRRQGEDFLQFVFPATVERIEEAAEKRTGLFRWIPYLAPATALAAAAAVFLMVQPAGQSTDTDWDGIKGERGLGLAVFLNGAGGARVAREGEPVAAKAQMRFRILVARDPCYLWVVSVDGAGQVSRLFPLEGDSGALVATRFEIPGGAVLDGRPGPERVFAICSPTPVRYAAIERLVQSSVAAGESAVRSIRGVPSLPDGSGVASVLLEKH